MIYLGFWGPISGFGVLKELKSHTLPLLTVRLIVFYLSREPKIAVFSGIEGYPPSPEVKIIEPEKT